MAQPTLQNYLGPNAQLLTTGTIGGQAATSGDPILALKFSDFAAEGLGTVTSDPDKWMLAIIRKIQAWIQADGTTDPGVGIDPTFNKSFTVRGTTNVIAYSANIDFYVPDTTTATPDPDSVI